MSIKKTAAKPTKPKTAEPRNAAEAFLMPGLFRSNKVKAKTPWDKAIGKADKWFQKVWQTKPNLLGSPSLQDCASIEYESFPVTKDVTFDVSIVFDEKGDKWVPKEFQVSIYMDCGDDFCSVNVKPKKNGRPDDVWFKAMNLFSKKLQAFVGADIADVFDY